ncbi:hypothetical protein [Blastopirellula retiformator]|uniref:Uncharacterized protein n=1 Tax=Blastopirellula retiformator TaxID=2527970 RepID=A0A5C5VME7_9BACT|nr:hypothetical protein [Blastopirellula retiformator]TWT39055.1 hypothetical protein Enr8_07500 [Blastopirellula retiformator]
MKSEELVEDFPEETREAEDRYPQADAPRGFHFSLKRLLVALAVAPLPWVLFHSVHPNADLLLERSIDDNGVTFAAIALGATFLTLLPINLGHAIYDRGETLQQCPGLGFAYELRLVEIPVAAILGLWWWL